MKKLNKNSADEDALNCLVIGTEDQHIFIIEAEAFTILATVSGIKLRRGTALNATVDGLSRHTIVLGCLRCLRCGVPNTGCLSQRIRVLVSQVDQIVFEYRLAS